MDLSGVSGSVGRCGWLREVGQSPGVGSGLHLGLDCGLLP